MKPWFDGKLDFSPPVTDFSDQGSRLSAAGLIISIIAMSRRWCIRGGNISSAFSWPESSRSNSSSLESQRFLNGYNFLGWQHGGVYFCAVSDVSVADLRQLKELLDR